MPPWPMPMRPARPGLPCAVFRGYLGVDLPKVNPKIKRVTCPFTGEELAAVPAHPAGRGDHPCASAPTSAGNVLIEGIVGVQKEAVLAAKRSIVTVEEIVDDFGRAQPNAVILPHWTVGARRRGAGRRAIPPTRRAITSATTPSTTHGTRSRASATASSPG